MTMEPEKTLAVGIDPSKAFHAVVAVKYPDRIIFRETVPNTPLEIMKLDDKIVKLAEKHGLEILYAPEDVTQYGGLLRRILQKRDRVIKQINPSIVSTLKNLYGDSKNDFIDARCAAAAAMRQSGQTENLHEKDKITRILCVATNQRKREVKLRTENMNALHQLLFENWSYEYKAFFSQLDGVTALAFWKKYPSARLAKEASEEEMFEFIYETSRHTISRKDSRSKAKLICKTAGSFPDEEPEVAAINEECIKGTVQSIRSLNKTIKSMEKKMEKLIDKSGHKLDSILGISTVIAGKIISEVGDVNRFPTRDKFASYAGVAPREKSSGKKGRHLASKRYNRDLKDAIMTAAHNMKRNYPESRAYYEKKVKEGKTAKQAKRCLARKVCDIIYSMLKNKEAYDPERHKRHSGSLTGDNHKNFNKNDSGRVTGNNNKNESKNESGSLTGDNNKNDNKISNDRTRKIFRNPAA
ncbi:MAG: IS110 family transposase [Candidatus Eremiobacteraeota bacterium]|nr:IS110 family transposase [Candidatus Eremiobacteraeota bacterium]